MKLRAGALLLLVFAYGDGSREPLALDSLYEDGRIALARGDLDRAQSIARKGRSASGETTEWRELFSILQAETLVRHGDAKGALALIDRTPSSGSVLARVRRLMALGHALAIAGNDNQAEAELAEAARVATLRVPALGPEIALLRFTPAFHLGDYAVAERFARAAIDGARASQQLFVLANSLSNLALVEMNREQWEDALDHFNRGARLARALGAAWSSAVMTGNVGWCYQRLGDLDEAADRFAQAEAVAEARGVLRVQPTWLTNIANVYVAREQYERALPYAERSLAAARRLGDIRKVASSLTNLALVHIAMGRLDSAARLNAEALAVWSKLGDHRNERYSLLNAARIDAATGAPDRALATLATIARDADQAPLRWLAQATAASIERGRGRLPEAEAMYQAALETGDSARATVLQADTYLFAFETNLIRFYDEYIDLLLGSGRSVDALRVAERSRARTLLEGKGLLQRGKTAQPALEPTALARRHNAMILCYWLAPRRSLLWVVTAGSVSVVALPPAPALETEINAYREEVIRGRTSVQSVRGARLFDMLVSPALMHSRPARVIIVPHGRLDAINFETFIIRKPAPHYWIEDATLTYTPSLQLVAVKNAPRAAADAQLLVIGNVPAKGNEFPSLARAGEEMNLVAHHFDQRRRVTLEGRRATPAAYAASNPRQFDYVHFVAHGTASVRAPLDSAVILASGSLTGHDIVKNGLTANLVTVSSCNSAGRRSYAGEGLVGLAWAFLRAGARRVVAAQWDVSDTATPKLMDKMYGELAKGHDPADALREAKLALLHSDNIFARPYYWAPFIIYGAP